METTNEVCVILSLDKAIETPGPASDKKTVSKKIASFTNGAQRVYAYMNVYQHIVCKYALSRCFNKF